MKRLVTIGLFILINFGIILLVPFFTSMIKGETLPFGVFLIGSLLFSSGFGILIGCRKWLREDKKQ